MNANGQTFGSAENAATDDELPDLVAVIGDRGTTGYIEKSALDDTATSPTDATALQRQTIGGVEVVGSAPQTVPVFDQAGTTQVDEFTIS